MSENLPNCPMCNCEYTYEMGALLVCPECAHEWQPRADVAEAAETARVVRDAVHVHDLQATILHLLGLDHERLTYRFNGRDFRLTDVHGHVVKEILA